MQNLYMKRFIFTLILLFSSFSGNVSAYDGFLSDWEFEVDAGYTSSKGLGYHSGYSTLGLMAMPAYGCYQPFIDIRGHWFDEGRSAANAGFGGRYVTQDQNNIIGANVYYDYRNTCRKDYHQLGVGFELLRCRWDIRSNVYIPLSGNKSHLREELFNQYENGYFVLVERYSRPYWGADLEFGAPVNYLPILKNYFNLYAAAGPYYIRSRHSSGAVGGRFRLELDLTKYISIEGRLTTDHIFNTNAQGVFKIEIPFSDLCILFQSSARPDGCCSDNWFCDRLFTPVFRNEIIPIKHFCRTTCNYDCR